MIIRALLILALGFGLLLLSRVAGARRRYLMTRWPAFAFATAALFELSRGGLAMAGALAALAAVSWFAAPALLSPRRAPDTANDAGDAEARSLLGLGANPTHAEIRRAYRSRMAKAHPDQGGGHADAARLTAARDRLLRKPGSS